MSKLRRFWFIYGNDIANYVITPILCFGTITAVCAVAARTSK